MKEMMSTRSIVISQDLGLCQLFLANVMRNETMVLTKSQWLAQWASLLRPSCLWHSSLVTHALHPTDKQTCLRGEGAGGTLSVTEQDSDKRWDNVCTNIVVTFKSEVNQISHYHFGWLKNIPQTTCSNQNSSWCEPCRNKDLLHTVCFLDCLSQHPLRSPGIKFVNMRSV